MMKQYVFPILALTAAGSVQGAIPSSMTILGARPDIILVVLIVFSLQFEPAVGAVLGFAAGLLHGSLVGTSITGFIVTRTLTGFLAGVASTRVFSDNPYVPALTTAWLTAFCEIIFMLANPPTALLLALRTLVGECIYNVILTLVIYWFMRNARTKHKIKLADARAKF
jgi:rod shape-determining protein MreD